MQERECLFGWNTQTLTIARWKRMCEKCKNRHVLGFQCPCECHEVYYGKDAPSEKSEKGGKIYGR